MLLFVGLGNPGPSYRYNRHNAGFLALDLIARREGLSFRTKPSYELAETGQGQDRTFLLKPLTFMNASGSAVADFLKYHDIPPQQVVVVSDDAALPTGSVRIRTAGSDGGQKGLRDILRTLRTDQVPRIRIGIGPPPPAWPLERWVLSDFTAHEQPLLEAALDRVHKAFLLIVQGTPWPKVMNECNLTLPGTPHTAP